MERPKNPWVAYPGAATDTSSRPRARLFCFPYAGAGTSAYRTWRRGLPSSVELGLVQLPGREGRLAEPLHTSIRSLAEGAVEGLGPDLDAPGPIVLFGHSMGALVAYEVARLLVARGGPAPALLVVSGHRAPHLPYPRASLRAATDGEVKRELERLGGTPAEVLRHPELLALVKPIFLADLQACEEYVHAPGPLLGCPIVAYGGVADAEAPPASLEGWREHTRGPSVRRLFPGGHFFLHGAEREVLAALTHDIAGLAGGPL